MSKITNFYIYPGLNKDAQVQIRRKAGWGSKQLTTDEVLNIVSDIFDVEKDILLSKTRVHKVHRARAAAQALMKEFTMMSFGEISKAVNREHHTTAMHSIKQSKNWLQCYDEYKKYYEEAFEYCTVVKQNYDKQTT